MKLNELIELAELLHKAMCYSNHTDGCGWYWENWDNPYEGSTRLRYLVQARKLSRIGIPLDQLKKLIKILAS